MKTISKENEMYLNNLSIYNCNCRLKFLYSERDNISERIDALICRGYDTSMAEAEYDEICSIINHLCNFRRNNPGCLLEGDQGYCFN